MGQQLRLDLQRHDSQYAPIPVHVLTRSHDRFLLIDDDVYHVGASIKDLGKRWFAIMNFPGKREQSQTRLSYVERKESQRVKMQETKAEEILRRL